MLKVKGMDKMLLHYTCACLTVENVDSYENEEKKQKILTSSHTMPDFVGQ